MNDPQGARTNVLFLFQQAHEANRQRHRRSAYYRRCSAQNGSLSELVVGFPKSTGAVAMGWAHTVTQGNCRYAQKHASPRCMPLDTSEAGASAPALYFKLRSRSPIIDEREGTLQYRVSHRLRRVGLVAFERRQRRLLDIKQGRKARKYANGMRNL